MRSSPRKQPEPPPSVTFQTDRIIEDDFDDPGEPETQQFCLLSCWHPFGGTVVEKPTTGSTTPANNERPTAATNFFSFLSASSDTKS